MRGRLSGSIDTVSSISSGIRNTASPTTHEPRRSGPALAPKETLPVRSGTYQVGGLRTFAPDFRAS